jgi:hypothetical protein
MASSFSYLAINLVVKKINVFGPKRKLFSNLTEVHNNPTLQDRLPYYKAEKIVGLLADSAPPREGKIAART